MPDRTFKLKKPVMKGKDVEDLQRTIIREFKHLKIYVPLVVDGIYGHHTRSFFAALLRARGISRTLMKDGITPKLLVKVKCRQMNKAEKKRFHSKVVEDYRRKIRAEWKKGVVSPPTSRILADSWGWHPGVHDGIDVICPPNAPLLAMVKSKVIDVRSGGWWGKAPSGDVTKGDGIIQLEVLENSGPFKKGQHIGYGHAEHARVRVGEIVQAGETIGLAGLAVAWHIHLMVNSGGTTKGIGTMDPRRHLDYAVKNG